MNRLCDQLLTGAAFSADQDCRARRRDLRDEVEQREHFVALADDVGKIEALLQCAFQLHVFFAQAARFHRLGDLGQEFVVGPRLGDVVHRAALERGARHVDRAVRGDQHDGELRITPANFAQKVEPIAIGKTYIEQQQIVRMLFKFCQAGSAGAGAGDTIAFAGQQQFKTFSNFGFIINYQDRALRHEPLSLLRGIRRGKTCPCREWSEHQFFQRAL